MSTVFSSCTVYTERTIDNHKGRWTPAPLHLQGLFRPLRPLRLRLPVPTVQRPPLQQRRLKLVLAEAAGVGGLLPTKTIAAMPLPPAVSLEQLGTAASRHQNSDDTATQVPTWDSVASSIGHWRHPHRLPHRRMPFAAARGATPSRAFARTTKAGSTVGTAGCAVRMASVPPLVSHLYPAHEWPPEFLKKSPHRTHGKALGADQHSWCPTDKLQILSWNFGPARDSDQRALADQLNGPWHIICIQEGAVFVIGGSLEHNFYIANQHHFAGTSTRDTFTRDFSCFLLQVPCTHSYASWAVEGMVVTGKFSHGSRPVVLVFHIRQHLHEQRVHQAEVRLYCLAPPDLRPVLEAQCSRSYWRLSKAVERELPAGDSNGQRSLSAVEAAVNRASIPWSTHGVSPLRGPGAEPDGHRWPDCCGLVVLPTRNASG